MPIALSDAPMPMRPSFQIDTKAAKASSSARIASAMEAPNVTSAGRISSRPECTMMIERMAAASENRAMRRAQIASREVPWWNTMRRAIPDR